MTHLVHHHLLTSSNATVILLRPTAQGEKPVIKSMNTAGLLPYLHQLKPVTGQEHIPVLDTEWQHEQQGKVRQIKIFLQEENTH